jgi:hypothetical protein
MQGTLIHMLHGHTGWVRAGACSPDGRWIASGSMDGAVKLWDMQTGACLKTLHAKGPYAGMNIAGVTGISEAQKAALKGLGAVEEEATGELTPATRDSATESHNLPAALTPFVGRASELATLSALLQRAEVRLLTLVGAGGMGKSRLVLELARASLVSTPTACSSSRWPHSLRHLSCPRPSPRRLSSVCTVLTPWRRCCTSCAPNSCY